MLSHVCSVWKVIRMVTFYFLRKQRCAKILELLHSVCLITNYTAGKNEIKSIYPPMGLLFKVATNRYMLETLKLMSLALKTVVNTLFQRSHCREMTD